MTGAPVDYFGMEFPEYKYVPYPRWLTLGEKKRVLVHDEEEEASFIAQAQKAVAKTVEIQTDPCPSDPNPEPPSLTDEHNEKVELLAKAKERGLKVDGRWKIEKLRAVLEGSN